MQFLSPMFLMGALALSIPIFLHLFRKEKTTRLSFASLMFIRRLPIKQTRRRKLKYLLLLALRCLGWLFIIGAFARPVVTMAWFDRLNPIAARSVVVLIDRSMSVSQSRLWEDALTAARERISGLDDADEAVIAQFAESVEVVSSWTSNRAELLEALRRRVKPSFEATSFVEGLRTAVDQLNDSRNSLKEIYLISDLQRIGLSSSVGWKAPPDVIVEVERLETAGDNLYVQQARLDREVFGTQYPNPVLVRVSSSPPMSVKGEAQLFIEGELRDRQTFELSETGNALLSFKPFDLAEGLTRGRVVLDYPDSLAADNTHQFVVERKQPRKIALVSDSKRSRSSIYLESAFSAGKNLPFLIQTYPNAGAVRLDPAETPLVVLDDRPVPPSARAFQTYLEQGGGVILSLGNQARADSYNRSWADLLPLELREKRFARSGKRPFTGITEVQWEHPIFSVFEDLYKTTLLTTQYFGYWKVDVSPDARVLASYGEGDPAVVEASRDSGRFIILTSSPGSVWSDFPFRTAFVPFWQATAQYATAWTNQPASYQVNEILGLEPWANSGAERVGTGQTTVLDPEGRRVLALDESTPDFIRLTQPGYYEIRSQKTTEWVAVNSAAVESDLDSLPLEDFLAVFVPQQSRVVAEGDDSALTLQNQEQRQSLWWLLLAAAGLMFLVEALLANWEASRQTAAAPMPS